MRSLLTPTGTSFLLLADDRPAQPAPTLLLLCGVAVEALTHDDQCRVGRLLAERGWQVASLDLPCHGADTRPGEPAFLHGWRARVAQGEDIVARVQFKVNDVVAHLITARIAAPGRLVAAGISRGGFMALHAAAANPAIQAIAALAPVTDLRTLSEFAGLDEDPLTKRLALIHQAEVLADRRTWLMICDDDARVGTDHCIAFSRALVAAAVKRKREPQVTLVVVPGSGHHSFPDWHDQAAAWLAET